MRCGRCKEVFDASANLLADVRYSPVRQNREPEAPASHEVKAGAPAPIAAPADPNKAAQTPPSERPQVWSHARANPTGVSHSALQQSHFVQESPGSEAQGEGHREDKDAPSVSKSVPLASTASAAVPPSSSLLPDGLTQNISYGLRREANVVPAGWTPDEDEAIKPPEATPAAPDSARIEPRFVASRLPGESSEPGQAPSLDAAAMSSDGAGAHAEPALEPTPDKAPVFSQDPELYEQDEDDDEEMPELTFEASRQFELVDEPLLADDPDAEPALAEHAEPALESAETKEEAAKADDDNEVEQGTGETVDTTALRPQPVAAVVEETSAPITDADAAVLPAQPAQDDVAAALSEDEVGFMREARRKAFWGKPVVRVVLILAVLGLVLGFAGQYAVAERNRLAAMHPALRPMLEQLCKPLQCTVGLPRDIASVAIDSSTFTRVKDEPTAFNLQVALKSSADMVLEMPALELTLTDTHDQPVLRRVLTRADTGAPAELPAHGEWNGVVKLQVPEVADNVTGYRLLAFYP